MSAYGNGRPWSTLADGLGGMRTYKQTLATHSPLPIFSHSFMLETQLKRRAFSCRMPCQLSQ